MYAFPLTVALSRPPPGEYVLPMFSPVLREQGKDRLVYATSVGFRVVFSVTALVIILSIAAVSGGSFFSRLNIFSLIIVAVCLFAALYLERWVFDRSANLFEKDVGILFVYARKKAPLDALSKVVLQGPVVRQEDTPALLRWTSRKTVMLSVVGRDARVYRLDMLSGGSARDVRRSAERLSVFCAIPLEDNTGLKGEDAG